MKGPELCSLKANGFYLVSSTLNIIMGELPNVKWGAGKKDAPPVVR
ncbi:hypothetical protein ACFL47_06360 [Candidatus Latescibacterota bacterium]